MGRFSPHIRHYVTIGLDAPGVTGINNSNRRAGAEPYDQTNNYRRSYQPQWWKPTGGWSTMFVPVRTGSTTKSGRFSFGITDRGEAQVRNLSLKKVIN